jgi:hypothetical protein
MSASEETRIPDRIRRSESLNALFSYFEAWAEHDPSLKFSGDSLFRVHPSNSKDSPLEDSAA